MMRRTLPRARTHPVPALLAAAVVSALTLASASAAAPSPAREMSVSSQVVPMGTFPWAVALEDRQEGTGTVAKFCGGTLIAPRYVMTVAHAPASWGARPAGLSVLDVGARIWRPDNLNGVTLHAEPAAATR